MIVDFGSGKCPACGDFGKQLDKKAMMCGKCNIAFDGYVVAGEMNMNVHESKYWN